MFMHRMGGGGVTVLLLMLPHSFPSLNPQSQITPLNSRKSFSVIFLRTLLHFPKS